MKLIAKLIIPLIVLCAVSAYAIEIDEIGEIDIHGYISQGYLKSDNNNYFCETEKGDTDFYEVGISMTTEVSENLRMGIQLLSYTMGDFGNKDFHINWANADYFFNQLLGIKAGKIKVYHGLFNRSRDADFLRTSMILPQSVYNEAWRATISTINGLEMYGNADIHYLGRLRYSIQAGKVSVEPDGGVALAAKEKLLEKAGGIEYEIRKSSEDFCYVYNLLYATPIQGLMLNASVWTTDFDMVGTATIPFLNQTVENAVFKTSALSATTSLRYALGNFIFISEYSYSEYEFEFLNESSDIETVGYYGNISYRFTNWLEAGLYYSEYYADRNNQSGEKDRDHNGFPDFDPIYGAWQKDTCLTFRFDITNNWLVKLEGHVFNGTAVMMKAHNMVDYNPNDIDMDKNWLLFGIKTTFSF